MRQIHNTQSDIFQKHANVKYVVSRCEVSAEQHHILNLLRQLQSFVRILYSILLYFSLSIEFIFSFTPFCKCFYFFSKYRSMFFSPTNDIYIYIFSMPSVGAVFSLCIMPKNFYFSGIILRFLVIWIIFSFVITFNFRTF